LAAKGCDISVVPGYLGRIAGYQGGNLGPKMFKTLGGPEISRRLRSYKRQLEKMAKKIAEIRRTRGFMGNMTEAQAFHIPEELEDIAVRLSLVSVEGFNDWNPQKEAILDLLELVKSSTGRHHYQEFACLIEAERLWVETKNNRP